MNHPLHIIILAAGDGTRMKSRLPKVLHSVGGRSMLAHVVNTARIIGGDRLHVVFNPETPGVSAAFEGQEINWVPQAERLGTGHAVQQAMPDVPDDALVLVLYGDTPLVPADQLTELVASVDKGLSVLSMQLGDPTGYGRIVRNGAGDVTGIVEEKDASSEQRGIDEVNTGIICAPASSLRKWLAGLRSDNRQGEYYLTDTVGLAHEEGLPVRGVIAPDAGKFEGVNDRRQLAQLERRYAMGESMKLMEQGVTIVDPARFDLRGEVETGTDVRLDINVVLEGKVVLGDNVDIGPGCIIRDCTLAAGTRVHAYSVLEGVVTTGACDIGPFARLRPGTRLAEGTRIGNFVEVKNASLDEGSKASHLSYLGDAEIGRKVNIGAGTITCNYDGANKYRTIIGDGAFIGSDSQLVAPVTVGRNATIGAGSTISRDAPDDQLTVSRSKQVTVRGWKRPVKKED